MTLTVDKGSAAAIPGESRTAENRIAKNEH
jgi:hypothetical protein